MRLFSRGKISNVSRERVETFGFRYHVISNKTQARSFQMGA